MAGDFACSGSADVPAGMPRMQVCFILSCCRARSQPGACSTLHAALQAMDAQAQLADLNDEIELLKLRLDIAEQEKCEAEQRVAGELRACLVGSTRSRQC